MATTTFSITSSGNDGRVQSGGESHWPPLSSDPTFFTDSTQTTDLAVRDLELGLYYLYIGLLRFDTSALIDSATVTGATLRLQVTRTGDTDSRSLVIEYYDFGGTLDTSDYTTTPGTNAHAGTALTAINAGVANDFALTNLSNINKSGITGLRLQISGTGAPTGLNEVFWASYDHATLTEPQLIVTWTPPTGYKDTAARFKLFVAGVKDAAARFKLRGLAFRDAAARFKLQARGIKDVASRFKLQVRSYTDAAARFQLLGPTFRDAAARFNLLVSGTTAWKDAATRFRLRGLAYKDAAARFLLQVRAYKDAATRFKLGNAVWKNATTRFLLRARAVADASARFQLYVPRSKDAATRFRTRGPGFKDAATRFLLLGQFTGWSESTLDRPYTFTTLNRWHASSLLDVRSADTDLDVQRAETERE